MHAVGGLCAVAAAQVEILLTGIWTFDVPALAAGAGAIAARVIFSRYRSGPIIYGTARFRRGRDLQAFRNDNGLIIGPDGPKGRLLRYAGPGNLLTIAPTRAGKGVGSILPNLPTADRPAIVIDSKGENFQVAGRARSAFGPVYALDPFGITGARSVTHNSLAAIHPAGDRFLEDATDIAEAIVADLAGDADGAHWNGEAQALITGPILHCISSEPPERRNLGCVREYLTLPPEEPEALLKAMQTSTAAEGLVARAANRRLQQNEREAASVASTAQRHTHFLDSPLIAAALKRSDFTFREVTQQCGSVFLVQPPAGSTLMRGGCGSRSGVRSWS